MDNIDDFLKQRKNVWILLVIILILFVVLWIFSYLIFIYYVGEKEYLGGNFDRQKTFVGYDIYFDGDIYNDVFDGRSFVYLGDSYVKDKNGVYYELWQIENADLETFEYLEDYYARDKNNIYYNGKILENIDKDTFSIVDASCFLKVYTRDKNNCYRNNEIVDDFECNNFYK